MYNAEITSTMRLMTNYLSYPWALAWGLYYYVLFQIIFLARFGSLNLSFNALDISLIVLGVLSVVLLVYFANKLSARKGLLFIPFVIALPFSVIGALAGGLFGFIGIIAFGIVPFVIALPLGYWLIKWQTGRSTSAPTPAA